MNLNNLKPAWQRFRLLNAMQPVDQEEILWIIERTEGMAMSKHHRFAMNAFMFILLTICCQGG
ncbi:hypothetical protein JMN32_25145 [Fulvivirga sp. 29W222]|uniref:Uncharacterized protein n=1 Tax=Fulvivirga marina TaxID=2494733 RepID=A0A937G2S9_9BACT|nr:hypothetical protein [Fulvivirga marina]MBL6449622.1 hypothetical protein [Fulvivirga marina]